MCTLQCVSLLTYHRNSRLRIWKLSAPMSQSIEVVGCRVCRQAGLMENYGDVFDQLSLDAYIQLQPYSNALMRMHCNIHAKNLYFFYKKEIKKKNPNVIHFNLIDRCRF